MIWDRFAEELIRRYSGRKVVNPFELLVSLKQENRTVETYIEKFEVLTAQIGELPERQFRIDMTTVLKKPWPCPNRYQVNRLFTR